MEAVRVNLVNKYSGIALYNSGTPLPPFSSFSWLKWLTTLDSMVLFIGTLNWNWGVKMLNIRLFEKVGPTPWSCQERCLSSCYLSIYLYLASCRSNIYMANNKSILAHNSHWSTHQLLGRKVRRGRFHYHIGHILVILNFPFNSLFDLKIIF